MTVADKYYNTFRAEKVYNDLFDLMILLRRLGIPTDICGRVSHLHDVIYVHTLHKVATNFTRKANETAWADEHP